MARTRELHFEDAIENHLVEIGGWTKGNPNDFDRELALFTTEFFAFVEATQQALWAELKKQHQANLEEGVLDTLVKELEHRGTLDVLRHGFKFFGKRIDCAYFRPGHGLNPDVLAQYQEN